jgi:capsular exopolysaccharide synthesis family protein
MAAGSLAEVNKQIAHLRTQLQLLEQLDPEQWIDVEGRHQNGEASEGGEPANPAAMAGLAGPEADLFKARQTMQLLTAKRDELSRFLRPEHPKILKLNEDIATQRQLMAVSRDEALRQLNNRRDALKLQVKNLETAFGEWEAKAIAASGKMADYENLRLDLQRTLTANDRMQEMIRNLDVNRTVDQENIGVLQAASVARQVPQLVINMAVALVLVCGLSFMALYWLGVTDDRFVAPAELDGCLPAALLGQIPNIRLKPLRGQLDVQFLEQQRFEFLEAFRSLRSALMFMGNGAARPKTLLVTSSVPREGKSTVAFYLAATIALANSRVLLIDADMRRASLQKLLAAAPGLGLAEILSGEAEAAAAIVPSTLEHLYVLPAGLATRNPGELVLSPAWPRLLAGLYPQFDYIVIDSPPVLATDDAAGLAPAVDGVLMVVRGAYTRARLARRGWELLQQRRARVLGLVFNRARASHNAYRDYQYSHGHYQWHPQQEQEPVLLSDSKRAN